MQEKDFHIFTLPNGLRCVHWRTDSYVSYCGMVINAGSRDEGDDEQGLAHFVEHTLFKGTRRRRAWHISNRMECVGGELNAYTTKEETMVYTNAPAGYLERSMDLLADIIGYSNFPLAEIEREKEVVIEEINSYLDSPSDSVYDQFEDMIFAGSGLGHNILGTPESVRSLTPDSCRGFIERYYVPKNMSFYCADPSDHKKVERLCLKYFGFLKYEMPDHIRAVPPMVERFDTTINKDGHQAHTIVGMRTFTRNDPRRHALLLLNNYLGGPCMNSRLNQEMREKRGMVYTVDSSVALMCNSGLMQIYFGADPDSVERGKKLIRRELERLAEAPIKPRLFQQVKQQYAGQLSVSSDHKESQAMAMGKSLLYYGEIHDIAFTRRRIMELTAEELRAVAETLLQSGPCCLTLR